MLAWRHRGQSFCRRGTGIAGKQRMRAADRSGGESRGGEGKAGAKQITTGKRSHSLPQGFISRIEFLSQAIQADRRAPEFLGPCIISPRASKERDAPSG